MFLFLCNLHPVVLINMVAILKASVTFHYKDVGSLSSFPALMLPEEYLLSKGLFPVGNLLAAQPGARWPEHMQCLLLAHCAAAS